MPLRRLFLYCLISWSSILVSAQIFRWENPNRRDSANADSLFIRYYSGDVFERDTAKIHGKIRTEIADEGTKTKAAQTSLLEGLNSKGSVIRGLTFGSAMGQSVQSSMDLQFSGNLNPDVTVRASIADHNMPVQADGYTQTFDEFDKIYMELGIRNRHLIRAGHLDLNDTQSYFSRYQRRTMGLEFSTSGGEQHKTALHLSAGISRSEFHRLRFQGAEGNQGPYRLTGRNGEYFIQIISGSEQVYIDGILQQRGENRDYTINYHTGELTFTSFRPILSQHFITVSYNYTNRNYSRYLVTGAATHLRDKLTLSVSGFVESDRREAPLSLDLSDEDRQLLAAAGNDAHLMVAPSARRRDWDPNKILYEKITAVEGFYYVHSTNPDAQHYEVAFSFAGNGAGDYRLKQSAANGRVFEFVGPGRGDYAAVRRLPAPEQTRVLSAAAEYKWGNGSAGADVSLSYHDRNLFSDNGNGENAGHAARLWAKRSFSAGKWTGTPAVEYGHINRRFHILDRINGTEFARDFNLEKEFSGRSQDRLVLSMENRWNNNAFFNFRSSLLNEESFYHGFKNEIEGRRTGIKTETLLNFSHLATRSTGQETSFSRGNLNAAYKLKKGTVAAGALFEHNLKKYPELEATDLTSYSWREIFAAHVHGDSLRTRFKSKVYLRSNDSVRTGRLRKVNDVAGIEAESNLINDARTQLSAQLHYRRFFYTETADPVQSPDFMVGNLTFSRQLFNNGLRLQSFYELGNGQEAQREFQYLRVNDGQGVYKWTDYNGDGNQQLDEFETAEYTDLAQYIRIYTNTVRYSASNRNRLQVGVFVDPATIASSNSEFLRSWNFNASFSAQNSFLKRNRVAVLNPFLTEAGQLLKNQNILAAVLFNARAGKGFNGSYRFTDTRNLINANQSLEARQQTSHSLNTGYRFTPQLRADVHHSFEQAETSSELFSTRNYRLNSFESRPKISWQAGSAVLAELEAAYKHRERLDGPESLEGTEFAGTLQAQLHKSTLRGSFSYISNHFKGNSFSVVGNQMLEGLRAGKNYLWNLNMEQQLTNYLHLNLSYDGRSSAVRTVHTGSVQLRASF